MDKSIIGCQREQAGKGKLILPGKLYFLRRDAHPISFQFIQGFPADNFHQENKVDVSFSYQMLLVIHPVFSFIPWPADAANLRTHKYRKHFPGEIFVVFSGVYLVWRLVLLQSWRTDELKEYFVIRRLLWQFWSEVACNGYVRMMWLEVIRVINMCRLKLEHSGICDVPTWLARPPKWIVHHGSVGKPSPSPSSTSSLLIRQQHFIDTSSLGWHILSKGKKAVLT